MLPISTTLLSRVRARRRALRKVVTPFVCAAPLALAAAFTLLPAHAQAQTGVTSSVLTAHNDNYRTGQNLTETILKWPDLGKSNNVHPLTFGKLNTRALDGDVYAQPLYVPNVYYANIPDASKKTTYSYHNTVYVVTSHNTVYAFDAEVNNGATVYPLWYKTYNFPSFGISPVPSVLVGSDDIAPEIGITSTPVINAVKDSKTGGMRGSLCLVAKTLNGSDIEQTIHILDIATGNEQYGNGTVIQTSFPGATGEGSTVDANFNSILPFDPIHENQQAALMLSGGALYVAFGSHGDVTPYHGWVLKYQANSATNALDLVGVFNTSPNGVTDPNLYPAGAGITMSGGGLAADATGSVYFATGVGTFNADQGGTEFGNSVLRVDFSQASKAAPFIGSPADFFTPFNVNDLNTNGEDLGTGGVMLLPDGVGPPGHPNMAVVAGQEGRVYLLDRANLGGFNPDTVNQDSQILQSLFKPLGPVFGTPAYFAQSPLNRGVYIQAAGDVLKYLPLSTDPLDPFEGLFTIDPTQPNLIPQAPARDPFSAASVVGFTDAAGFPGASPEVTANGASNGIIWTVEQLAVPQSVQGSSVPNSPPINILHAYKAYDPLTDQDPITGVGVIKELYSGLAAGARDVAGIAVNYAVPTIANGKVYVGGHHQLTIFGMLPANKVVTNLADAVQPDHYLVSGPVPSAAGGFNSLRQRIAYSFQITAIGPDGNPIKLSPNYPVHISSRTIGSGSLHLIGNLTFQNDANTIFTYAFPSTGQYDLYVSDDNSHTSVQPNFDNPLLLQYSNGFSVQPPVLGGSDHLQLIATPSVRNGGTVTITATVVGATGNQVPVGTFFGIDANGNRVEYGTQLQAYDTLPNETQGVAAGSPGFAYENTGFFGNTAVFNFGRIVGGFEYPVATATATMRLRGVGKHVIVVSGIAGSSFIMQVVTGGVPVSGTVVVNVTP